MRLDMFKDGHLGGYVRGGDPGTWCPHLWRWIVKAFDIHSVLDVGCGEGQSTRFFHKLGCEATGVDGCRQAIVDSVIPEHAALHDFCDGPFRCTRSFDLVWSCEFVEHVDEEFLPHILSTFALSRKVVAITHAFPGQESGHHHVNCRPSRYWIDHIERLGFTCLVGGTRQARQVTLADHHRINHFARGGLLFVRTVPSSSAAASPWQSWWKATQINWGFRLSSAYRQQWRTYRQQKRKARKMGALRASVRPQLSGVKSILQPQAPQRG